MKPRVVTPLIFIDRREAMHNKSVPNRNRLLRRIREFIKASKPQNIGASVKKMGGSGSASPVRIAKSALDEPNIVYARSADRLLVLNGNVEYERGDELPLTDEDQQTGTQGGLGNDGEDDFIVNVAKDEFLDLFFEDCELPNLSKESMLLNPEELKSQPAGFGLHGSPNQLSILRTYKQSIGRRIALRMPLTEQIDELEERLKQDLSDDELNEIEAKLEELRARLATIPTFDKVDLRYKKAEPIEVRAVEAVYIMIMDISGSMGEHEKTIARRWFSLNYAFMKRKYKSTELVFIAHTEQAYEMEEDDFFSTRVNGGTKVSPALAMANKIIRERYDPERTNVYVSHASDGDNWSDDAEETAKQAALMLDRCQLFTYLQCNHPHGYWSHDETELWKTYESVDEDGLRSKMISIDNSDEVYTAFKRVFKRNG